MFFLICPSCPFQNLSIWPKTHPFFPILHVFAPLNDVRAYIALSWKTTLITWIFLRGWYPTWNTSGPPRVNSTYTIWHIGWNISYPSPWKYIMEYPLFMFICKVHCWTAQFENSALMMLQQNLVLDVSCKKFFIMFIVSVVFHTDQCIIRHESQDTVLWHLIVNVKVESTHWKEIKHFDCH